MHTGHCLQFGCMEVKPNHMLRNSNGNNLLNFYSSTSAANMIHKQ